MRYRVFNFVAFNLLTLLLGNGCFCQIASNHLDLELSIQQSKQDSIIRFDPCAADNIINVLLRNNSDSTIRLYKKDHCWGYRTFSFEIETADTIFEVSRSHRLWWRCVPDIMNLAPNDSVLLSFQLIDSTCENSNLRFKPWIGLPVGIQSIAWLRVIYNPPSAEIRNQHAEILNRRRDYRSAEYRDTTSVKFDSFIIPDTSRRIIDSTEFNYDWAYGKRLVSKSVQIEIRGN
ncbi:MAG: hypothetical protein GQ574_17555 [Crocinitomix sp.]|nr:hypothetical protein [Crocinitomix sp.]